MTNFNASGGRSGLPLYFRHCGIHKKYSKSYDEKRFSERTVCTLLRRQIGRAVVTTMVYAKKQNKNTAQAKKNSKELIAGRPNENGRDEKKITNRLRERTRCDKDDVKHGATERHYTLGRQPDGNKMWWDAAGPR